MGRPLLGSQALSSSLFADASNFEQRFVESYDQVKTIVSALKTLRMRVVLTSGSFDIIHEGHSMYLEAARGFGDFLIVGLDSDDKIQTRKGPGRPAVPQMERLRMVTHQRGVGLVTLKGVQHPRWALIKAVEPDVLVATADTYTPAEIAELEARYCGRVEVLERMATVSTSARLRRIQLGIPEPDAEPDAAAEAEAAEVQDAGPGSGDELARAGHGPSGKVKQLLLYLPVIHRGYQALLDRHADAARAAARPRLPDRVPQPGQGHPGPAGRRRPRGTCARPGPAARCASWSPPTCPPRSPATRWCCPTRRSCASWPPGTTSAATAPWSSSPRSCAGTGSGAGPSARPASTARSRPATCRAGPDRPRPAAGRP